MKFLTFLFLFVLLSISGDRRVYVFGFLDIVDSEYTSPEIKKFGHFVKPYFASDTVCKTKGGKANDTGLKVWCWDDITIPSYVGKKSMNFSNNQLKVDSECCENQVSVVEGRLKFSITPLIAQPNDWCDNDFNMRAEISTTPWLVNHPKGTEEWFGWSYILGENYVIDQENPWLLFQVHEGSRGKTPLIALWVMNKGGQGSGRAGELHIVNSSSNYGNHFYPTNIIPKAGQALNIVVHVVWGDAYNGLLQVWIDGVKVHDRQARTVRFSNPVGGNAKWGIYKWPWRDINGVTKSQKQGIDQLQAFMGPLRIITRSPNDKDYFANSFKLVSP
ncbi:heparin lyase I family protein [Zobellia sp. B3R18]|uniref:heparin lyase I family protein n=1 Tax=Zobellia sp. B3R18 TaxID=2841568 RepID=UPI001C07DE0E|nr:heparin lyase I family protein [Zobellia sp. B3R18]MBU2974662.1 polysaccharide lyase [Zobellia sp. B3R18]